MIKIRCSWCAHEFETILGRTQDGDRGKLICPKCWRTLPSSIKESTGNVTGRKHIHREHKQL